ncbi:MAG: hypothetical protein ACE5D7_11835, partial [Fidelibacterota bacterium]
MLGLEKGDMRYQLCTGESIGARGSYNGLECAGVNFYYDRDTGEILEFTNAVIEGENILSGLF